MNLGVYEFLDEDTLLLNFRLMPYPPTDGSGWGPSRIMIGRGSQRPKSSKPAYKTRAIILRREKNPSASSSTK